MIVWIVYLVTCELYLDKTPVVSKMYNKLVLGLLFFFSCLFLNMCAYLGAVKVVSIQ